MGSGAAAALRGGAVCAGEVDKLDGVAFGERRILGFPSRCW